MLKFWGDILMMNPNNPASAAEKKRNKNQAVRAIWRFGDMRKNAMIFRGIVAFFLKSPKRQIALTA